jgi:hypothetical protein
MTSTLWRMRYIKREFELSATRTTIMAMYAPGKMYPKKSYRLNGVLYGSDEVDMQFLLCYPTSPTNRLASAKVYAPSTLLWSKTMK